MYKHLKKHSQRRAAPADTPPVLTAAADAAAAVAAWAVVGSRRSLRGSGRLRRYTLKLKRAAKTCSSQPELREKKAEKGRRRSFGGVANVVCHSIRIIMSDLWRLFPISSKMMQPRGVCTPEGGALNGH